MFDLNHHDALLQRLPLSHLRGLLIPGISAIKRSKINIVCSVGTRTFAATDTRPDVG